MLRSILFAIGIFLLILGAQSLIVDKLILRGGSALANTAAANSSSGSSLYQGAGYRALAKAVPLRMYQVKDWMPWSLLAAGTVIVIYTYSLNGGGGSSEE
jgi:hypothetical protein